MTAHDDPARATLALALDAAEEKIESATDALLRFVCGGLPWADQRIRTRRVELEQAMRDRAVLRHLLRALDQLDAEVAP